MVTPPPPGPMRNVRGAVNVRAMLTTFTTKINSNYMYTGVRQIFFLLSVWDSSATPGGMIFAESSGISHKWLNNAKLQNNAN